MSVTRNCNVCGDMLMPDEEHTDEACDYMQEENVTMAPLLSKVIGQAVAWALADCVLMPTEDGEGRFTTGEERAEFRRNPYAIPRESLSTIDPGALSQNIANRLLGFGNSSVRGVYGGNASPRDVFEATFAEPDRNEAVESAFDLLDHLNDAGIEVDGVTLDLDEITGEQPLEASDE